MNLTGQTLGDFQLQSIIAHGPRATLYRARQLPVARTLAFKVYDETLDPDRVREAYEATQALTHAHVLPVDGFDVQRGLACVAMRYMPIGSLRARWRGVVPLPDIARILPQIAAALDHAHAHGVAHHNLKPANILIDHPGNAFVTDFGIPPLPDSPYAAPEQARDGQADARADVYALGALLYEMLTGRAPIARRPRGDDRANARMVDLPSPRSIRAGIPPAVEAVVVRAMSIDPESRYATPGALAEAFAEAAEIALGEQAAVRPARSPLWRWLALGAIGLLAAIGLLVAANQPGAPAVSPPSPTAIVVLTGMPSPTATARASTPAPTARVATASATTRTATPVLTRSATPSASATRTPAATLPTRTPTPAFQVVSLELKPPPIRVEFANRLELLFDVIVQSSNGGPFGQLFAYLPDIDGLVTTRIGAQVTTGAQVLKVTLVVDCAGLPQPATTHRIFLEIRPTDRGPTLYATAIEYTKTWCR